MVEITVPEALQYTQDHEWLQIINTTTIRVGITDFAQSQLGDVVFVQLPEKNEEFAVGDSFAEVESTKSVSDVYAPFAGKITAVNEALAATPELMNSDPYGEGWLVEITTVDSAQLAETGQGILNAEQYRALL